MEGFKNAEARAADLKGASSRPLTPFPAGYGPASVPPAVGADLTDMGRKGGASLVGVDMGLTGSTGPVPSCLPTSTRGSEVKGPAAGANMGHVPPSTRGSKALRPAPHLRLRPYTLNFTP